MPNTINTTSEKRQASEKYIEMKWLSNIIRVTKRFQPNLPTNKIYKHGFHLGNSVLC